MDTNSLKNYLIGALLGSAGAAVYNMAFTKNPAGPMADLTVSFQMFKDGQWSTGIGMAAPALVGAYYYSSRMDLSNVLPGWAETMIAGAAMKAITGFMYNR